MPGRRRWGSRRPGCSGAVAHALGLFREEEGFSNRANLIVDETGRVVFIREYEIPQVPDFDEIIAFLKK
jgi:peroxiredoxin